MKPVQQFLVVLLCSGNVFAQTGFLVGTNEIPVVFEDNSLSQTNRILICNDLSRIFAFENCYTNAINIFENQATNYQVVGSLRSPPKAHVYPDNCHFRTGFRPIKVNTQYGGYIERQLSDSYTNAFWRWDVCSNTVQAADDFVFLLNSGGTTNLSPQAQKELVWLPPPLAWSDDAFAKFANSISNATYLPPSVLQLRWLTNDETGTSNLWSCVIGLSTNALKKTFDLPIIFEGGKWKIDGE